MMMIPGLYGIYEDRISGRRGPETKAEERSELSAQMDRNSSVYAHHRKGIHSL